GYAAIFPGGPHEGLAATNAGGCSDAPASATLGYTPRKARSEFLNSFVASAILTRLARTGAARSTTWKYPLVFTSYKRWRPLCIINVAGTLGDRSGGMMTYRTLSISYCAGLFSSK